MARGQFIARVNGHVTGHHDEWGAFDREEIASLLHPGDNDIEVDVVSHHADAPSTTSPSAFAASIHITHADGKEERIVTNEQWQARSTADSTWQNAQTIGPLSQTFGIGTDRQQAIPGPDRITTDASFLRKNFSVDSPVRTARLSITALGAYQAFLNGKSVAPDTLLAPGWFKLLLSDTYPSWGYMVKKGATTWWERWNGDTGDPSMNSYNHYAFGSVMAWVYQRAAGIDTDATGPGFHHLTIRPHFDPALPQLHTEYDSPYGTIVSDWQQSAHRFTITIPPNTTATVTLPNNKTENIGSGTHSYTIEQP